MRDHKARLEKFIMFFSFRERRKRALLEYKERVRELKAMDLDELEFEYISFKSSFERKKYTLGLFIISIVLSILMNVWKYLWILCEKVLRYASAGIGNEVELAKAGFCISVMAALFLTALVLAFLILYIKELNWVRENLLIVESVMDSRDRNKAGKKKE